jgi:glycosyltransferase involved in cell wall biosynthesis
VNILQVIPVFNPPEFYGGSQRMAYQISKELVKRGHDVCVYTSDAKRGNLRERVDDGFERYEGINIIHFKHISYRLIEQIGFVITPGIGKSLERMGAYFDIIHLHEPRGYQHLSVWRFASKKKIPYVVHAHGVLRLGQMPQRLYDFVCGKEVLRNAAMNIALNEAEVEDYEKSGVDRDKIRVIPNGIDLSQYIKLPLRGVFKSNFGVNADEKIILYVGRIERTKGIDFLVRCFARLVGDEHQGLRLVIAGKDDGFLGTVKSLVHNLGVADLVFFSGALSEKDKISAYVDSVFCAYLGQVEPFGLVPLEAAACGTPVIVSKGTYMAKIVDEGKFGFSVKFGDVDGAVSVMKKLLDDNLSNDMSSRAIDCAKQFSIQKTVDKIENLYFEILSKK